MCIRDRNIYELFGKKCSTCDGTGHVENILNYEISNFKIKNIENKSNQSNNLKAIDADTYQATDEQEKIIDKELINSKDLSKENSSNKKEKENDNDNLNQSNSKEKNIITVDLTNDEKIVFSQLGINPLIKLGKDYLTSNNFVLSFKRTKLLLVR